MVGNHVSVTGNITREFGLHYANSGTAIAEFSIAVNRKVGQGNDAKDEVSYFDVVCFGDLAENISESCDKGSRVCVEGRLEQQRWEKDGEKRAKVRIVADEVSPSHRWASSVVTKNERKNSDS